MVARAHGNHAALALGVSQLRQLVAGAALLERRGVLQIFKLQVNLRPGELRERFRFNARRVQQMAVQALGGLFDIGQAEHGFPLAANVGRQARHFLRLCLLCGCSMLQSRLG